MSWEWEHLSQSFKRDYLKTVIWGNGHFPKTQFEIIFSKTIKPIVLKFCKVIFYFNDQSMNGEFLIPFNFILLRKKKQNVTQSQQW